MTDALIQKGVALKVAFGALAVTGYFPEDGIRWSKPAGEVISITDENGATVTVLIIDPRDIVSGTFIIKDSGGSITPPIAGATFAITDPAGASVSFRVENADVTFARSYSKLNIDLIKEGSMTYT